jgi:hypothetical protein
MKNWIKKKRLPEEQIKQNFDLLNFTAESSEYLNNNGG